MADIEIITSGKTGKILVDGKEVSGVLSYEISHLGGCTPVLMLHIPAHRMKFISNDADVHWTRKRCD